MLILKQLDNPQSITPLIRGLDKPTLQNLGKSETRHLISRTLILARSPVEYKKWCGTVLTRAITNNYGILAEGNELLGQLIKNLENYNETINVRIFNATVEAIDDLAGKIRGKPTLTREILTPKLAAIIGLYVDKMHYNPLLVIRSLQNYVSKHSTTFRPFGNKLRARLVSMMNGAEFASYPESLKNVVFATLATLVAIEKTDPEDFWHKQVNNIIGEVSSVLAIYKEFLVDDGDLLRLIHQNTVDEKVLGPLNIDFNEPSSILSISSQVDILMGLLSAYLTTPTAFAVKVPLGKVVALCEAICTLDLKFHDFKMDVTDPVARDFLRKSIDAIHHTATRFLHSICSTYRGSLVPHIPRLFAALETLVPIQNKKYDYAQLIAGEERLVASLACVQVLLGFVSSADESHLVKFVDCALMLVEKRQEDVSHAKKPEKQPKNKAKKKASAPLADILSHQHLFVETIPQATISVVRRFLASIVEKVALPPTQYNKVMRYIIVEAVNARHAYMGQEVPQDLRNLLVSAVMNPAYDKASILPIVASLLPHDETLSVFLYPRFPPLIRAVREEKDNSEDSDEEENEENEEENEEDVNKKDEDILNEDEQMIKENILNKNDDKTDGNGTTTHQDAPQAKRIKLSEPESSQIKPFKPTGQDTKAVEVEYEETLEESVSVTSTTSENLAANPADKDDSDFEMPEIDVGSDDE